MCSWLNVTDAYWKIGGDAGLYAAEIKILGLER